MRLSFIGVEVAAMTAKRVKNPRVNVGRASLLGTAASAILYLAVSAAVMGLVPHRVLIHSAAPFVLAFGTIFPHLSWAGKLLAALAVVSGIGALNGWTLVTTEVSRAAANDGMFPRAFAWTDRKDTAWFGIVMAALLPSLLMLWSYTTKTGLTVFTDLVYLTVVTVAIPYLFSACAQLSYLVSGRRQVQGWQLVRDLSIAGAGVLFSMWVTFAAGYQSVYPPGARRPGLRPGSHLHARDARPQPDSAAADPVRGPRRPGAGRVPGGRRAQGGPAPVRRAQP
jgi:basic amino acid/polyamine antiporter, APA family